MTRRNLLLSFDAFGTLFAPKRPVHVQYGEIARSLGVIATDVSDEAIESSFRAAFKSEAKRNPNYGKQTNLNATKWWTNIIHETFRPLLSPGQSIHPDLAPRLLHRFATDEGYTLFDDARTLFRQLSRYRRPNKTSISSKLSTIENTPIRPEARIYNKVVVGVITNSDDRVPGVLSSLGLAVSERRFGQISSSSSQLVERDRDFDIDFCVMSYDVGIEKPDARIFEAAEEMAGEVLAGRERRETGIGERWERVYVGDEYRKDVLGAVEAGWNAVWVCRDGKQNEHTAVEWLGEMKSKGDVGESSESMILGVESLDEVGKWLMTASD